jgi:hypothetical protein
MSFGGSAGPAGLAVAPPQPSPAAAVPQSGGSDRSSAGAHSPELSGQVASAAAGGTGRPGAKGATAGSHRASPATSLASAASVASSNASATSSSSRIITASRRGRGMRLGDRAVAVRSPSPTGSGNVSAMASPITSASCRHATPQVSPSNLPKVSTATAIASGRMSAPSSQALIVGGSSSRSDSAGAGTDDPAATANVTGVGGVSAKTEEEIIGGDEDKKHNVEGAHKSSHAPPDSSGRYPIIAIGGGSASPSASRSPKATGLISLDPHGQKTPKHNHLSARSNEQGPMQQTDRPPSPIQGPSSAAAAAAAAAKALRSRQGMIMRTLPSNNSGENEFSYSLEGRDNGSGTNPSSESCAPPHKHYQPTSHHPHHFAYGDYQPHTIPHSPGDNAAAAAAYYAAMYGHNIYGGYYNHEMTTNWPEEVEGSERSGSADSDDRTKKADEGAHRHFDERNRAYLQYHRQLQPQPQPNHHHHHHHHHHNQPRHYYEHHSDHHRGFYHHPGDGNGCRPPSHVGRDYVHSNVRVGGQAAGEGVESTIGNEDGSPSNKNGGKFVMGSASPIYIARGMSTTPLNHDNTLASGRHVTPHHHNHNTRSSSRKAKEEESEESEESKQSLSASSIFRGRPGPSMSSRAADDFDDDDEDSPQRILLSLSKGDSFEDRGLCSAESGGVVQMIGGDSSNVNSDNTESNSAATLASSRASDKKPVRKGRSGKKTKQTGKGVAGASSKSSAAPKKSSKSPSTGKRKKAAKSSGKTPSSPDEPPRIQHSFSQNTKKGSDPFYFDVSRSCSNIYHFHSLCLMLCYDRLLRWNKTQILSPFSIVIICHTFLTKSQCECLVERLLCSIIKGQ